MKVKLQAVCFALLCGSVTTALAEPKVTAFEEHLYPAAPIGAAPFLAVLQLSPQSFAATVISFTYSAGLGTNLCLHILSRDGRYKATAAINMNNSVSGNVSVQLKSNHSSYIEKLRAAELAIDASYRDNCTGPNELATRTIVWFGPARPAGPITLLFQAYDNDAYFIPSGANTADRIPCNKVANSQDSPATAFNTICEISPKQGEQRLLGSVVVVDLAGNAEPPIAVDATIK
jgi:hypothetical protein